MTTDINELILKLHDAMLEDDHAEIKRLRELLYSTPPQVDNNYMKKLNDSCEELKKEANKFDGMKLESETEKMDVLPQVSLDVDYQKKVTFHKARVTQKIDVMKQKVLEQ